MLMRFMILFLFIISIAGMAALFFKRRIEETIPATIFSIIAVLYFAGMLSGSLLTGICFCGIIGILSVIYIVRKIAADRNSVLRLCVTPGLVVFVMLFIWIMWLNDNRVFSSWDEFSHWGLAVKNMDFFDYFSNHPYSTDTFSGYPPATALWQYLFVKVGGVFSENSVYCAGGGVLVTALFLPVLKRFDWNKFIPSILAVACLIAVPFIFFSSYIVLLYVDPILGILFAYIMFFAFTEEGKSLFGSLNIGLGCFILCLTKESGIFLAAVAIAAILLVDFCCSPSGKNWKYKCLTSASGIAGALIGKYSWALFRRITETKEAWNMSTLTLKNLIDLLRGKGADYQYDTIATFYRAAFKVDFGGNMFQMRYISWIGLAIFCFLILKAVINEIEERKWNIYILTFLCGLGAYTLGLLLLYVFTYSEWEARHLASYQRYLSSYLIGIFCFCLSVFFYYILQKIKNKSTASVIIIGIGYILLLFLPRTELDNITCDKDEIVEGTNTLRMQYRDIEQYIPYFDYHTDKIYLVCQNTQGFEYLYLRYLLSPVPVGGPMYSVGESYGEADLYTYNYTLDQWLEEIVNQNVTYVYLHLIDEQFIEKYGSAFEGAIEQGSLYRVYVEDTQTLLRKCD